MFFNKVYRDLAPEDAARRAEAEVKDLGYRITSPGIYARAQQNLFGKDDAYVSMEVERAVSKREEQGRGLVQH